MKTLARLVPLSLLCLVVHNSLVHAQSEADAIGSTASPAASTPSVRRAAPKFADASIGLELDYKVNNADVCVAWPKQLQDAGCEGMDLHKLVAYAEATAARGPSLRSMAVLRYENSTATISVVHTRSTETTIYQGQIDDFMKEHLEGTRKNVPGTWTMSGSTPGSLYDVMEINDVDALRFELTSDVPSGVPLYPFSRAVGYILVRDHGLVTIVAETDPQHMQQTRVALESIVKTVRMPKLAQRAFVRSVGYWLKSGVGVFLLIVLLGGFIWAIANVRPSQKKRSQRR